MTIYYINPVAKPRMTRQDKWPTRPPKYRGKEWPRPVVKKWRHFEYEVLFAGVELPEDGAHVIFHIAMPESWSKKKKATMCGKKHKQTPDLDNLLKGLADAVYGNDAVISDIRVSKVWDYEGKIQIFEQGGECQQN